MYILRSIHASVKTAELHDASPESITSGKRNFDTYWNQQREVMVDRCRLLGFPKLFITIAPTVPNAFVASSCL